VRPALLETRRGSARRRGGGPPPRGGGGPPPPGGGGDAAAIGVTARWGAGCQRGRATDDAAAVRPHRGPGMAAPWKVEKAAADHRQETAGTKAAMPEGAMARRQERQMRTSVSDLGVYQTSGGEKKVGIVYGLGPSRKEQRPVGEVVRTASERNAGNGRGIAVHGDGPSCGNKSCWCAAGSLVL